MDTALRIMYEIVRGILIFISAILHFSCLMLCTLLFAVRKLREACDDFFDCEEGAGTGTGVIHGKRA